MSVPVIDSLDSLFKGTQLVSLDFSHKLSSIIFFLNHYIVHLKPLPELQVSMSNTLLGILTFRSNGHLEVYILKKLLILHPILPHSEPSPLLVFPISLNGSEIYLGGQARSLVSLLLPHI